MRATARAIPEAGRNVRDPGERCGSLPVCDCCSSGLPPVPQAGTRGFFARSATLFYEGFRLSPASGWDAHNFRVSRLRRIADRDRIFFATTNLRPGISPLTVTERDLILGQLSRQQADGDFRLFGYVVMPTHLHLLLAPDRLGLVDTMYRLKRFSGQEIKTERRLHVPIWQPRFYDFVLRRVGDFWGKLDYIHENPVAAKLVVRGVDWPWSSAAQYCPSEQRKRPQSLPLPVDEMDLPQDRTSLLNPVW